MVKIKLAAFCSGDTVGGDCERFGAAGRCRRSRRRPT